MKKVKYLFLTLITILIGILFFKPPQTQAAVETLIMVGKDKYNITVTSETKVSDIAKVLGEAKLETDSAFGGKAYTFYTDENYSNYLYIETSESGKIVSYGSIDETFKTSKGSYGEDYSKYAYQSPRLGGYYYERDGKVAGIILYNVRALELNTNMHEQKTAEFYVNTYSSNPVKYLKGLSSQSTLMFNALAKKLGKDGKLEFNEEYFYINEQLKEFSSSIRDYANDASKKNDYAYFIKAQDNFEIDNRFYVLNPLIYAIYAGESLTNYNEFKTKNISVFDYDINKKKFTIITVNKDIFKEFQEVELTSDEKEKLAAGRKEYQQAITNLNKENKLYLTTPKSDVAEELFAGELVASKKQGITDYVNAIRAGAGLPKLSVNEDAFKVAQHMSVLTTYRFVKLGLPIEHKPAQPAGVTETFYKTAVGWNRTMSENIGENLTASDIDRYTPGYMMSTINGFLDDRSEVGGVFFSHRSKIISPIFQNFGYGISAYMYVNEFSGVSASDVILDAWPANGVTFLESLYNNVFYWSAGFNNRYEITLNTKAKIKNLKNGKTWEFNEEEGKQGTKRWYRISERSNYVLMFDNTIEPDVGDVYEITLFNVYDTETSKNVEYTYRTTFQYFDESKNPNCIKTLKIQVPDSVTKVDNNYYVGLNEEVKLSAVIDDNSVDEKILTWESSNQNLISVTQNGTIKTLQQSSSPVTISVKNNHTNLKYSITIIPDTYEKMSLNYKEHQFNSLDESINVKATLNTGKAVSVTWSATNDVVSVKDGVITPLRGGYTEVYAESPKYGKRLVRIYVAVPVSLDDGRKLYVGDVDGNGVFGMSDATKIGDFYNNGVASDMARVADVNGDGKINSEDSSLIMDFWSGKHNFHPGPYKPILEVTLNKKSLTMKIGDITNLEAIINPKDTTDSPRLTWNSSNSSVAIVQDGKITAKGDGRTTITVTTSNNKKSTCEVIVGTGISKYLKGDLDEDSTITVDDAVEALYYYIEKYKVTSHKLEIGDMDNDGRITVDDAVDILMLYVNK